MVLAFCSRVRGSNLTRSLFCCYAFVSVLRNLFVRLPIIKKKLFNESDLKNSILILRFWNPISASLYMKYAMGMLKCGQGVNMGYKCFFFFFFKQYFKSFISCGLFKSEMCSKVIITSALYQLI